MLQARIRPHTARIPPQTGNTPGQMRPLTGRVPPQTGDPPGRDEIPLGADPPLQGTLSPGILPGQDRARSNPTAGVPLPAALALGLPRGQAGGVSPTAPPARGSLCHDRIPRQPACPLHHEGAPKHRRAGRVPPPIPPTTPGRGFPPPGRDEARPPHPRQGKPHPGRINPTLLPLPAHRAG